MTEALTLTVIGAIVGASLFWFLMRLYDKTRKNKYPEKKIISDISYYAPAAAVLTSLFSRRSFTICSICNLAFVICNLEFNCYFFKIKGENIEFV